MSNVLEVGMPSGTKTVEIDVDRFDGGGNVTDLDSGEVIIHVTTYFPGDRDPVVLVDLPDGEVELTLLSVLLSEIRDMME